MILAANDHLTRRIRFRRNWRGKMILQVEQTALANHDPSDPRDWGQFAVPATKWRDARTKDLEPKMFDLALGVFRHD